MKKALFYFFGIIFCISSFSGFVEYGFLNALTCIIVGILLILHARSLSKDVVKQPPTANTTVPEKVKTITMHVAGVTFKNDDGSDRQLYLRKIKYYDPPFDNQQVVTLEKYFWNNEPAYYIKVNNLIIGNVPKEFIRYLEDNSEREYKIEYFHVTGGGANRNYGGELRLVYLDTLQ